MCFEIMFIDHVFVNFVTIEYFHNDSFSHLTVCVQINKTVPHHFILKQNVCMYKQELMELETE